ncbi:hypothetical protein GALL_388970 [mine drainage metagenome]|uniref:DUF2917 domain-containing protein n=1 Tax=mine drainage metagenome TaxID=410659 RepID=A0A1J5QPD8_9ZZZZ
MDMTQDSGQIRLAAGRRVTFRGARDVLLECTEGVVWLTVEGQQGDFLLAKNELLCIKSSGLAIIQGLPSGSVQLVSKVPKSIRQGNRFSWTLVF